MVTIQVSVDDGCQLDTKVADLLRKYELPGVFYVPVHWEAYNRSKGWEPLSKDELLSIAQDFEVGSHTITHPHLTKIPFDEAKREVIDSRRMLEDLVGRPVKRFCYPRGYANDQIRDIVRDHYEEGRSTLVGSHDFQKDPAWQHTAFHAGYNRTEYSGKSWYEYGLERVKWVFRRKTDAKLYIWLHSWEIEKYNGWRELEMIFMEIIRRSDESLHPQVRA